MEQVKEQTYYKTCYQIHHELWEQLSNQVKEQTCNKIHHELWEQIYRQVNRQLNGMVITQINFQLK